MKKIVLLVFITVSGLTMAQVPNYVPQSGLLNYWSFTGNTNDASTNANHLVNNGAVLTTDRNGTANAAYSFNGTNQYMMNAIPSWTFSSTSSFTISAWISKSNSTGGVALMNGSGAPHNCMCLLQGGGNMTYGTNKQQSSWIFLPTPYTLSVWSHYVCVYDAGVMTFYKDNVQVGTSNFTHTGSTSANLPFYVGRGINGSYFSGEIDDIGIWNRALSPCEISDLYTTTPTVISVDAGVDQTVCNGTAVTLQGTSSGTSAQWDNGVANGVAFTPTTTGTYTYTAIDANGCSAWDQVNVTVSQGLIDGGADLVVCEGSTITLTGTNATGISWDNGVVDGAPFVPSVSTIYAVTGTDNTGCTGTDSVEVTLVSPVVNAGSNQVICAGDVVTLSASGGAVSYTWNNGVVDGVSFVPTLTGYYTAIGTDTMGCSSTDSLFINVKPASNIQAGNAVNTCAGDFVTLNATGGLYYIWTNSVVNGSPFIPLTSGMYVVTGADTSNCVNSDSVYVTVNQPSSSSLSVSDVDQYDLNGTVYTASGTYTQVIQNAAGCDSTITLTLELDFTGISELDNYSMMVSPNPASIELNVKINENQIGESLQFYTADGRLVKTVFLASSENKIDISELVNGVYICRFEGVSSANFKWIKK